VAAVEKVFDMGELVSEATVVAKSLQKSAWRYKKRMAPIIRMN
jgi:hypothetical protein